MNIHSAAMGEVGESDMRISWGEKREENFNVLRKKTISLPEIHFLYQLISFSQIFLCFFCIWPLLCHDWSLSNGYRKFTLFSPLRLEKVHFRRFHRGNVVTDTGNTRPPFYLTVFFRHIEKLSFLYSLYDTSCCKNFAAFLFCNNILWLQHRRV